MKQIFVLAHMLLFGGFVHAAEYNNFGPTPVTNLSLVEYDYNWDQDPGWSDHNGTTQFGNAFDLEEGNTVYKSITANDFLWVAAIGVNSVYFFNWADDNCEAVQNGKWGKLPSCIAGWTASLAVNAFLVMAWRSGGEIIETCAHASAVFAASKFASGRSKRDTSSSLVPRGAWPGGNCNFDVPIGELHDMEGNWRFTGQDSIDIECQNICAHGFGTNPILRLDTPLISTRIYDMVKYMQDYSSSDTGIHVYDISGNADEPVMYCRIRMYTRQIYMCPDINVGGCSM
ncbi:hypothetical protein NLG97_g8510 [Lecanicillium saksenae]|uniref:Uncharacterized protein n=1 Tax=Lecanicillium saksenae TaxID=468837 RepID=A0ACC1QL37_9HYPO|nr:hypothetical protein NLG97_g8510 [Lecanicillium saksenae]